MKDMKNEKKNSVMNKHIETEHKNSEKEVEFEMVMTGQFRKASSRQINESIKIKNMESVFIEFKI